MWIKILWMSCVRSLHYTNYGASKHPVHINILLLTKFAYKIRFDISCESSPGDDWHEMPSVYFFREYRIDILCESSQVDMK